ncbi:unnamed protein product [Closterium sp. NIES-53]
MLALCREHRLEHRTKHIALRYFLARELQQRGQLRLAYVASQANTADIFTKALQPCDHQRFCTMLACFALLCFALLDWSSGSCAVVTMVGAVGDARVVDTLEARLEDARRRHEANEYGPNLPLAVIEAVIHSVWAEEHPAQPASPRPVNNEGGIDVGVNASGNQVGRNAGGTSRHRGVIHADEVGDVQAREMRSSAAAGSSQVDVGGRRSSLSPMSATHVTAGGIAPSYGYFNFTPDRISVTPLLVGRPDILTWKEAIEPQLEMAGLIGFSRVTVAMLEEHYPNLRLTSSYNLLKRLSLAPSTRATLNEDSLTSYILQDEAMQEPEQPSELLPQVNYVAPVKQGGRPGQRAQSGGGSSSGWKRTKDVDKKKSAKDSGCGGGSRRRECWLCGDPNHLSFECPDRSDSDDDDAKGGRGRSGSRRPRRGRNQQRKEKQSTKSSTSAKDADSSAGGKGRDDKEASCSLVGVVEPTVSLAPEAGEDFQAMAAAVQANPAVVMLDSGCSHHLMGTKEVFVDLQPSGDVKHVRGFNGALQDVQGRGTVALQGEAGRQVLIPDVLYVPGMRASLLSAEVVALRAIVLVTKSTPDRLHARLAHVGTNSIQSSEKHEVATGMDIKSLVSSYVMLRIFLSIIAVLDLNLMQLDMKNAFLQSKLDWVLYMYHPDYFNDGTGRVTCWVLVYVDDLLAANSSAAMLKELLKAAFELREISPVQKYLGLEIVRDRSVRKMWLHQQGYADKLRRRFLHEEQNGRTPKTPVSVDAYTTLTFNDEEAQVRQEEEYQQKVGSLHFAVTTTRPDIAFACSKLGSGLIVRSNQHCHKVDHCLAYLAKTRDTTLEFGGGAESLKLVGYVDADDAGDKQNRTSMGGYVFVFGGVAISWSSQRIKCAMLSSTESEYVAATKAGKEGRRLRFLLA